LKSVLSFKKNRPWELCGLFFLCLLSLGFSLSSSKSEGRSFPLPGNFEEVWNATLATLEAEKIPLDTADKARGYIRSATFPLYKKEYKEWAKAPSLSSSGFCALEIGIVEKDPTMTVLGIRAYFKRRTGFSSKGFRKRDGSRGRFEGLLAKNIHERLVEKKFPALKSVILGCDLHYDDKTARYFIAGADEATLAYEQGLRNGDVLMKISGQDVTPGNLFGFFQNIPGESLKKFTIARKDGELELPISIFFLNPNAPHLGFRVERDPKTLRFKITYVRAGSPAEREGFLPGDILLKQNGILLDRWENYYRAILAQKDGEAQIFRIERAGNLLEKKIIPEGGASLADVKKSVLALSEKKDPTSSKKLVPTVLA
jgi:hypothetical protein